MPRATPKTKDLAAIEARRQALKEELAALDAQAKEAEAAAKDAGRDVLLSALSRVKIAAMSRDDAKVIANAIGKHGGEAIARSLGSLVGA